MEKHKFGSQLLRLSALVMMLCCSFLVNAQNIQVTGVVVDEGGEPLVGVNVLQQGTTNGTITDIDGKFTLNVGSGSKMLHFTYVGFVEEVVNVSNQRTLKVVLKEDKQNLEEVVVIGYGTAKKKDLTGAVASVRTEKLESQAPRTVQDLLRGQAAGLTIAQSNTAKGDASLMVRGNNTLKAGNSPLIVLDGVIYEGAMTDINPMDIQSIDILKDASSAAVYGAKAANGVVAIVTRKGGQGGKPAINFNANVGFSAPSHMPDILDGPGFVKYRQDYEIGRNTDEYLAKFPEIFTSPDELKSVNVLDWYNYDQKTPVTSVPNHDELVTAWLGRLDFHTREIENYLAGRTEDWQKAIFQTGLQQDYTVSISNKTDNVNYYWSLGYADREGVVKGDRYTNYRTRLNLESTITKWLKVGINANFAVRDEGYLAADASKLVVITPYALDESRDTESLYQRYPSDDQNVVNAFYDNLHRDRTNMYYNLNASLYAIVKLPFDIEYQVNFTPHYQFREYYNHEASTNVAWKTTNGNSERTVQKTYNWQVDNVFRWSHEFNKIHRLEATFLINAEKGQYWSTTAKSSNFSPNDILGYHRIQAGTVPLVESNDTYRTGDALMGRLFYSLMSKYMITASVRRDGYSAFGLNNKRATFPSVALGWVFSSEKFWERLQNSWFNYGKLRLSWGQNGNRDIGQYEAISDMTSGLHPYINQSGGLYNTSQIYVNRMANSSLKWERSESLNLGLDFSLFNDFVSGSIEGYVARTNDLLVDRKLPSITGFASVAANLGQLQNKGLEITLNFNPIRTENVNWRSTLTFSMNRRTLKKLYGDMEDIVDANGNVIGQREKDDPDNKWFIGHDPDQIWEYERVGVWQLGEETEAAKFGCQPGDFKYKDQNGDGVMTNADKIFQGYTTPRSRWSWNNDVTFLKNFTLSASFYAYFGQYGTFNRAANSSNFPDRSSEYDQPRWTPTNPINDYARIGSKNIGNNYVKKSFIRMDNLALSYNVPKDFLKKAGIQQMRLSLSVRNPFIWSPCFNYWYDPEVGDYSPRTVNLGVNFTL